jgi:DNA repair/transcription protein MET18/MMS19
MPSVSIGDPCSYSALNHRFQLIPLLLRGLDLPDAEIRGNVIDTFLAAAEGESPEKSLVSEHSVTLVNAMLRNSKVGEMTSIVRVWISSP